MRATLQRSAALGREQVQLDEMDESWQTVGEQDLQSLEHKVERHMRARLGKEIAAAYTDARSPMALAYLAENADRCAKRAAYDRRAAL